jgi:hypothetical protein
MREGIKRFKKRPMEVEAIKWDGFIEPTLAEIALWCDESWADESMLGDDCSLIIPNLQQRLEFFNRNFADVASLDYTF